MPDFATSAMFSACHMPPPTAIRPVTHVMSIRTFPPSPAYISPKGFTPCSVLLILVPNDSNITRFKPEPIPKASASSTQTTRSRVFPETEDLRPDFHSTESPTGTFAAASSPSSGSSTGNLSRCNRPWPGPRHLRHRRPPLRPRPRQQRSPDTVHSSPTETWQEPTRPSVPLPPKAVQISTASTPTRFAIVSRIACRSTGLRLRLFGDAFLCVAFLRRNSPNVLSSASGAMESIITPSISQYEL